MPLTVDDEEAERNVTELAARLGTTVEEAVKIAAKAELDRLAGKDPFDAKLEAFYARHPLPPPTGEKADKAFFDELSGELD